MACRSEHKGSEPTLEVFSVGVVDENGRYVQHVAISPKKAHSDSDLECSVMVREADGAPTCREGALLTVAKEQTRPADCASPAVATTMEPKDEEITAVRKASRARMGHGILRAIAFIEQHRATLLGTAGIGLLLLVLLLGGLLR